MPLKVSIYFVLAIHTAAMDMMGGEGIKSKCRSPDIMSDAAYLILTKDGATTTCNFFVDEDVVVQGGVTNLKQYAYDPSKKHQ